MPPTTTEDHLKFLISCSRNSNNGRPDFGLVAADCGIVSKGAAAKRYERLFKAYGSPIKQSSANPMRAPKNDTVHPKTQPTTLLQTEPRTKKRKEDAYFDEVDANVDDEEELIVKNPSTSPSRFECGIDVRHEGEKLLKIENANEQNTGMGMGLISQNTAIAAYLNERSNPELIPGYGGSAVQPYNPDNNVLTTFCGGTPSPNGHLPAGSQFNRYSSPTTFSQSPEEAYRNTKYDISRAYLPGGLRAGGMPPLEGYRDGVGHADASHRKQQLQSTFDAQHASLLYTQAQPAPAIHKVSQGRSDSPWVLE